jgi:hypothetical protein
MRGTVWDLQNIPTTTLRHTLRGTMNHQDNCLTGTIEVGAVALVTTQQHSSKKLAVTPYPCMQGCARTQGCAYK